MTAPAPAPVAKRPASSVLAWIALGLAAIGLISAFVPILGVFAWMPLLAALIVGIIALVKRSAPKWASITAIVASVVGWVASVVMTFVFAAGLAGAAVEAVPTDAAELAESAAAEGSTVAESMPSSAAEAAESADSEGGALAVGEAGSLSDGTQFSVASTETVASAPDFMGDEQPGNYLKVDFTVTNGGTEAITVSSSDVTALSAGSEFSSDTGSATADGEAFFAKELNPGTSTSGTLYFSAPEGTAFDTVVFETMLTFGESVTVTL